MKRIFIYALSISFAIILAFIGIGIINYVNKQDTAYGDSYSTELYELKTTMGDLYLNIDLYEEEKAGFKEKLQLLLDEQSAIQEEIEAGNLANQNRLDELASEIESTQSDIVDIETRILQIKTKITEIEERVNDLYTKVNALNRNILTAYVSDYLETEGKEVLTPLVAGVQVGSTSKLYVEGGKIYIGAGVSKVLVSGMILFKDYSNTSSTRYGSIFSPPSILVDARSYCEAGGLAQLVFPPVLLNVTEGKSFTMYFKGANSEIYAKGDSTIMKTYLTVEVVE